MTRSVKWSSATVLVVILLLVAAWFLLISPKRSNAATVREAAAAQEVTNQQLEQKLAVLTAQAKELPKHRARLKALQGQLPTAPELPDLVRALNTEAKASGISLKVLNPKPAVSREAAAGAGGATVSPPASAAGAGGPYLQEIPMQIEIYGEFAEIEDFLSRIEELKRVMLTVHVTVEVDAKGEGEPASFGPDITDPNLAATEDLKMTLTTSVFMATPGSPVSPGEPAAPPIAPAAQPTVNAPAAP